MFSHYQAFTANYNPLELFTSMYSHLKPFTAICSHFLPCYPRPHYHHPLVRGLSKNTLYLGSVRCQVSGVRCQVPGVRCQVSGDKFQVSGVSGEGVRKMEIQEKQGLGYKVDGYYKGCRNNYHKYLKSLLFLSYYKYKCNSMGIRCTAFKSQ